MPQQSPGDQREDTALEVAAAVAAVMAAAALVLVALLGPAVAKVLRGASWRLVARQVHAAATAIARQATDRAERMLVDAEQRIETEATEAFHDMAPTPAPTHTFGRATAVVRQHPPPPSRPPTLPSVPVRPPLKALPPTEPLQSVAESIRNAGLNAVRDVDDAFARAAQAAAEGGVSGTRAAQKMLDDLARQGITAYVDRAGRRWELAAYCEMATRTAASRHALTTQLQLMGPAGFDLVVVDEPAGEIGCHLCEPWVGKVLSLSGRHLVGELVSTVDAYGRRKTTNVAGSLAQAIAEGLLHPNCRHALLPFVDGAGSLPLAGGPRGFVRHGHPIYRVVIPQEDSGSYKAQQKQRALELVVRRAVAAKSVALDPSAKARANRRLVAARINLESHVRTYHLTRQRYREHPAKAR